MGNKLIKLEGRLIGRGQPTFVIAELGINHNGEMSIAKDAIRAAYEAGADAVKLQTYITEKRVAKDSPIFDILKKCELSFEQQEELFQFGNEIGISVFSTPFDDESIDFLSSISCPLLKIASFDSVNLKLLDKVRQVSVPVIMSTGMTSLDELGAAWRALGGKDDGTGCDLALMHCVSSYPTELEEIDMSVVGFLDENHLGPVGFSDHTIGSEAAQFAIFAGASLIEKHFTLDTKMEGPDHTLSVDPMGMHEMVAGIRRAEKIMGIRELRVRDCEQGTLQYRRVSSL